MNCGVNHCFRSLCGIAFVTVAIASASHAAADSNDDAAKAAPVADNTKSPYSAIWLRNVFDLKPTTPPAVEEAKPAAPPPNVHLTGITTILGNRRALFMVQDAPEPGKPAKPEKSMILSEGQRQDALEVLEIYPKERSVKIQLDGVVSTISFETNKNSGGSTAVASGHEPRKGFGHQEGAGPTGVPGYGKGASPNRPIRPTSYGQPRTDNSPSSTGQFASGSSFAPPVYSGGFAGNYGVPTPAPAAASSASPNPATPSQPPANANNNLIPPSAPPQLPPEILAQAAALSAAHLIPDPPTMAPPDLASQTGNATSGFPVPTFVPTLPNGAIPPPPTTIPTLPSSLAPQVWTK